MDNTLRMQKAILYRLKRQYGLTVTIYVLSRSYDNQTGRETTTIDAQYEIKRAILLPKRKGINSIYSVRNLIASRQSPVGEYAVADRHMILDASDLSSSYTPSLTNHVEHSSERWEFVSIDRFEDARGYIIGLKNVEASDVV